MTDDTLAIVPDNQLAQNNWDNAGKVAQICRTFVDATAVSIQGKRYIPVEGWQSIAAAWGYTPSTEEPQKVEGGYRCKAQLKRDRDGAVISEAYGYVGDDEVWKDRARYANEAMAQTRAISRVCRNKFAFVAVLMGIPDLVTTPAEEAPSEGLSNAKQAKTPPARQADPETTTYQGIIEKTYVSKAAVGDKDERDWYSGMCNGRELWTRKPDVGQELMDSLGGEVVMQLVQSKNHPNKYQVMSIRIPDRPIAPNMAEAPPPDDIQLQL